MLASECSIVGLEKEESRLEGLVEGMVCICNGIKDVILINIL